MRLSATSINNRGVKLSVTKLKECAFELNSKVGKALYVLYDMGYLSSPSAFNRETVLKGLLQEFPSDVSILMSNMDGNFNIDSLRIRHGLLATNNESFRSVIKVVYSYYRNSEELEIINKLLCNKSISNKTDYAFNPKISVSESVINFRCPVDLNSRAVQSCLVPDMGYEFKEYKLSHLVVLGLCRKVGVPDEVFQSHNTSGKAIFLKGLSLSDEADLINPLIKGDLPTSGEFASLLESSIFSYYKDIMEDSSVRYGRMAYDAEIYSICFKDRMDYVARLRKTMQAVGGIEYLLTQTSIVYQVPSGTLSVKRKEFNWDTIGNFILDWGTASELHKVNLIEGVSGEFISEKYCTGMKYKKTGAPTMLKSVVNLGNGEIRVDTLPYYNIINVRDASDSEIPPLMGRRYQFVFSDISEVLSKFGARSQEELTEGLYKKVITSFSLTCLDSEYRLLVSDLAVGLIFMDCGYPEFKSLVSNKSFITKDIFYKACYDADMLFKSLGF